MKGLIQFLIIFAVVGVALWVVSFGVDALRSKPVEPKRLAWAPDLAIKHVDLDGTKVRYVSGGSGPTLVLLHTLRTQLDIFHKMIPELQKHFTVYAVDYPGHGWSDIPDASYHPEDFYGWVEKFLDKVGVEDATVAGISIGGTIALELAARENPRIRKVVAINPYDYDITYSSGLKGSSVFAQVMLTATDIPVIGGTFMRLRNSFIERRVFEGGVADPASISDELFLEVSRVGNRPGHSRGFINLLRNDHAWQEARGRYSNISMPVLLIYSDQDWAPEADRKRTADLIPGVRLEAVADGGHFLTLDKPRELERLIVDFAGAP